MKKIVLVFSFLLVFGCNEKKNIFIKKDTHQLYNNIIKQDEFNGKIEDFEKKLKYWTYSKKLNSEFNKVSLSKISAGKFNFKARFSLEEFHPYIQFILYKRKMDFSQYKGIKFFAKGESNILYKLKIFEREHYYNNMHGQEIWYKIFYCYNKWKEYKISFNEMYVEEYWEQDYISDNQQIFTNITGICITVQNIYKNKTINGTLYIDDIELY